MDKLSQKRCVPCEGGVQPLKGKELHDYQLQLEREAPGWSVIDDVRLHKKFKFINFKGALEFVNRVGKIAEEENHHPDINFGWGYAEITLSTHAIGGLSENDFVLAAKISHAG